jgi:indolepyruvate ferredoxin oxidoreductase, beta subunit
MSPKPIDFLLTGVGGQGATLAGDVVAHVGLAAGYWVKCSEIHGMSQRGGSVETHVRWGERVYSPTPADGEIDVLLAFEKVEALRSLPRARRGALCVVDFRAIVPPSVTSGGSAYPSDEAILKALRSISDRVVVVDALSIANSLGDGRTSNVVMLGALSVALSRYDLASIPEDNWLSVLKGRVPDRFVEVNLKAFQAGRAIL